MYCDLGGYRHGQGSFQVLPVPSLGRSQSCPSVSHWPWTGPLSSWLDGRSASTPSTSCTHRCLCQTGSCSPGESLAKSAEWLWSHNHKNLTLALVFFHNVLDDFPPLLHLSVSNNSMEIVKGHPLPKSSSQDFSLENFAGAELSIVYWWFLSDRVSIQY